MRTPLTLLCALLLLLTACGQDQEPASHMDETDTPHHAVQQEPEHHTGEDADHHAVPSAPSVEPEEPVLPADNASPLPEKISSASVELIRDRVWRGASAGDWLPLLADVTWADLAEPGGDFDCVWEACIDIISYVAEQGANLTEDEYRILLSHAHLDGAYGEGYAGVLYDLYVMNPTRFARIALDELPQDQREDALQLLLYDWSYYHGLDEDLSFAQRLEILTARLEEDKQGTLAASPDVMYFWYAGQSARFLPVNAQGVYAASYASDHPEVAEVDEWTGAVTAIGPGEAVITLHFEGDGTNQDFTCAVHCDW